MDTAKRVDLFNCLVRRGEFINLGGTQRGMAIASRTKTRDLVVTHASVPFRDLAWQHLAEVSQ